MNWFKSCFFRVALVCMALASCASLFGKQDPGPVYDVRNAIILSGPNMPPALLSGIGDRVNKAINTTVRTEVYPRVVLTIRIVSIRRQQGYEKNQTVADITIDAASVEDGSVIAVSKFSVTSVSNNSSSADEILAEDISARIRSIFTLKAGPA